MEAPMKSWKRILLISLVVLTILSLLLSACGPTDNSNDKPDNGKNNNKDKDRNKDKDKDNGNKVKPDKGGNLDKVTICHKTGSAKNPYVMIRISNDAVKDGHAAHEGDIIPAPEGGCQETALPPDVPAK
jgi:major membrane immunogen (membrane-anchored lipoprotein)